MDAGPVGPLPSSFREEHDAPGDLALIEAFVNTYDTETDDEELTNPAVLGRWLARHGLLRSGTRITLPGDLERARELREALRQMLRANHDGAAPAAHATAVLEEASRRAPLTVSFSGGRAALSPSGAGVDEAFGHLLAIAFHAMHDGTWQRLKVCSNANCAVAFWDASRNRSGRWCSMAICGNRAKVASFRQRQARGVT